MDNQYSIGFRLKMSKDVEEQFLKEYLEYYYARFTTCEFKIKEKDIIEKDFVKKLYFYEFITDSEFSIHLPKNILTNSNELKTCYKVFYALKGIELKKEKKLITHIPENIDNVVIENLKIVSIALPNNSVLLLENVENNSFTEELEKINKILQILEKFQIKNIFLCLDLGHLLSSASVEGLKQKDIFRKLENNKKVMKNIKEIHIHDFDEEKDHLNLFTGLLDQKAICEFINTNQLIVPIIIETNTYSIEEAMAEKKQLEEGLKKWK